MAVLRGKNMLASVGAGTGKKRVDRTAMSRKTSKKTLSKLLKRPLVLFSAPGKNKDLLCFKGKRGKYYNNIESDVMFVRLKSFLEQQGFEVDTLAHRDMGEADYLVFIDAVITDPPFKEFKRRREELRKRQCRACLVIIDAPVVNYYQHTKRALALFDRVLTWDPSRVDHKKFFPYRLPEDFFTPNPFHVPFKKKKFLCMINANKYSLYQDELYSERKNAAYYFEKTEQGIDVYGPYWNTKPALVPILAHTAYRWRFFLRSIVRFNLRPFKYLYQYAFNTKPLLSSTVKGRVDGPCIETYAQYKFAICYENARNIPGYCMEKIFNCLNARCIPVYWGDPLITKYVPKSCFIDMRDFRTYDELYAFLNTMDEKTYNRYIKNIDRFVKGAARGPHGIDAWIDAFYKGLITS